MNDMKSKIEAFIQQISDYSENLKEDIHKILSNQIQVEKERDIAIKQLNDLGIDLGEDVSVYKDAIENITSENVMYTVCDTEWGMDAVYVCPSCLQPVEKDYKFCSQCGKALSWINAPKPIAEVKNKFMAYAKKNSSRLFIKTTTAECYKPKNFQKKKLKNEIYFDA